MNKQLLIRESDKIAFVYIEKSKIYQEQYTIIVENDSGKHAIAINQISILILGIGTQITHRAVQAIAEAGCQIFWINQNFQTLYCYGQAQTLDSKNILKQIKFYTQIQLKLQVIRKMYSIRYPEQRLKTKTLEEMRGYEGKQVQLLYKQLAVKYGIDWQYRDYGHNRFDELDIINRFITMGNQVLYAICAQIINSLGYSTAIGFIHTGKMQQFVYDIADLYKERTQIEAAFSIGYKYCKQDSERDKHDKEYLEALYKEMDKIKFMSTVVNNINSLFIESSHQIKEFDILD